MHGASELLRELREAGAAEVFESIGELRKDRGALSSLAVTV